MRILPMARLNDKQTIPARDGRNDHSKDKAARSDPTEADEAVAEILNNAIKKKKNDATPPKSAASRWEPLTKRLSFFIRRGNDAPVQETPGEEDEEEVGRVDEEAEGERTAAGAEEHIDSRNERELSSHHSQSPDPRFAVLRTQQPKRKGNSSSIPPAKRALRSDATQPPKRDLRSGSKPIPPLQNKTKNQQTVTKTNAKRKQPGSRPDIYDLPQDEQASGSHTDIASPPKRAKKSVVGKTPIILSNMPIKTRAASGKLPKSSVLRSVEVELQARSKKSIPAKPMRGRPPKKKASVPQAEPEVTQKEKQSDGHPLSDLQDLSGDEESMDGNQARAVDYPSESEAQEQEELGADDGFSNILLDPSPIKTRQRKPTNSTNQASSHVTSRVTNRASSQAPSQARSISESRGTAAPKRTFAPPSNEEMHDLDDASGDESLAEPIIDDGNDFLEEIDTIFGIGELERMCNIAEHVGKSRNNNTKQLDQVAKHEEPTTDLGSSLFNGLQDLTGLYETEDPESDEDSTAIEQIILNLQDDIDEIFADFIKEPEQDEESQDLLKDLFFCVLPAFVRTIHAAAKKYILGDSVEQFAMKEMLKLAKMLKVLANGALYHNSRPRSSGTKAIGKSAYHFSRPTRSNMFRINALCSRLETMLAARRKAKKRKAYEQLKLEQEKERQKQEDINRRAIQQKLEEIEREVKLRLRQAAEDPITGPMYRAQIARKLAEQTSQRQSSSKAQGRPRGTITPPREEDIPYNDPKEDLGYLNFDDELPLGEQDEEEEYEDDDPELERVSVFEKNNNRLEKGPLPFSNEEQLRFVEFMKFNDGPWKYSRIAEELKRTMDEIIVVAKDLQGAMDRAHDMGLMNKEGDDWTYHIWDLTAQNEQ